MTINTIVILCQTQQYWFDGFTVPRPYIQIIYELNMKMKFCINFTLIIQKEWPFEFEYELVYELEFDLELSMRVLEYIPKTYAHILRFLLFFLW